MFNLNDKKIFKPLPINSGYENIYYEFKKTNGEVSINKYTVPFECRNNPVVKAFIEVYRLQKYNNYSFGSKEFFVRAFKRLCSFISECPDLARIDDIGFITPNFMNYLENHEKKITHGSIKRIIDNCRTVLNEACDPINEFNSLDWWDEEIRNIKNNIKTINNPDVGVQLSLKDYYPNSEYTDEEILISMRKVSIWLINHMNDIRKKIKNNKNLCENILSTYDGLDLDKTTLRRYAKPISDFKEKLYGGMLLEHFLDSGDETAIELMYYNSTRLFVKARMDNRMESLEKMISGLKARLRKIDIRSSNKIKKLALGNSYIAHAYYCEVTKKTINCSPITTFPPISIFSNTISELQAFQFFLASERIQPSGLERLKISDVVFDDVIEKSKRVQINYYKGRSDKLYSTSVFKRNTPIFEAIRDFIVNENEMFEKLPDTVIKPGYVFQYSHKKMVHFSGQLSDSSILPMKLLGMKGSQFYEKCTSEVQGCEPFLEILEAINESNVKRSEQMNRYTSLINKAKYDKSFLVPSRELIVTEGLTHVNLKSISHSRALMDDADSDDAKVTASLSAHSESTHADIYVGNYKNINKLSADKTNKFGADVGDEMANLAKKVAGFREDINIISENSICKKLGISYSIVSDSNSFDGLNDILNSAFNEGYDVGIIGEISDDTTTYIIQSPVVCALILSYINHIDSSLEKISIDSELRAKILNVHKIYLKTLIDSFPAKMVKIAKKLKYNFPFPEVV